MTARLSDETRAGDDGPSSPFGKRDAPVAIEAGSKRVVSVSARRNGEPDHAVDRRNNAEQRNGLDATRRMTADTVFLTPRVLDQSSFDELTDTLRGLIDQAEAICSTLADSVECASNAAGQSEQSSSSLQERLHLGARMLKAFQSQIDRVETALADVEDRNRQLDETRDAITSARAELDAERSRVVEQTKVELDALMKQTAGQLDAELRQRVKALADIDARIEGVAKRAATFQNMVEVAERNVSTLVYRNAELSETLRQQHREVREFVDRCNDDAKQLRSEIEEAALTIKRVEQRSTAIGGAAKQHEKTLATLQPRARQLTDELNAALNRMEQTAPVQEAMQQLLEGLQQWEPILRSKASGGEGALPEPFARTVKAVQTRVDADIASLIRVFREMADGLEHSRTGVQQEETGK